MSKSKQSLIAILREQGFGSRKECLRLVREGEVEIGLDTSGEVRWRRPEDPEETPDKQGLLLKAKGFTLPYRERLFLAFHKPAGTECSRIPTYHRSVFSFFPAPYLERGLQSVGRLDADTTGLLLFTDSGTLNHFLTSPKRHVPKVYRVETRHPITADQAARLAAGVELRSEDGPTLPAEVSLLDERHCDLTLSEGKYHQVKRMWAAVGNRVERIHRIAIGALRLEDTLAPGQWRHLEPGELELPGIRGL